MIITQGALLESNKKIAFYFRRTFSIFHTIFRSIYYFVKIDRVLKKSIPGFFSHGNLFSPATPFQFAGDNRKKRMKKEAQRRQHHSIIAEIKTAFEMIEM